VSCRCSANGLLGSVVSICSRGGGWWKRCMCGGGFDYVVAVGGLCWDDDGYGRAGFLVSALVGKGYRQYTATL
jgi:hypothetical protein